MTIKRENDLYLRVVEEDEQPQLQESIDESLRVDFQSPRPFLQEEPLAFNSWSNNSSAGLSLSFGDVFGQSDPSLSDFERRVMEIVREEQAAIAAGDDSTSIETSPRDDDHNSPQPPRRARRTQREVSITNPANAFGFDSLDFNRERTTATSRPRRGTSRRQQSRSQEGPGGNSLNDSSLSRLLFGVLGGSSTSLGQFAHDSLKLMQRTPPCPTVRCSGSEPNDSADLRFVEDSLGSTRAL